MAGICAGIGFTAAGAGGAPGAAPGAGAAAPGTTAAAAGTGAGGAGAFLHEIAEAISAATTTSRVTIFLMKLSS
jgi:hypothetical protein